MPVVGLAPAGNQIKWIWADNPIEDNSINNNNQLFNLTSE